MGSLGIREKAVARLDTEQRAKKFPRMVHEPWHHLPRNKRHTDLMLTASRYSSIDQLILRFRCAM
jgi:hypothetical protein